MKIRADCWEKDDVERLAQEIFSKSDTTARERLFLCGLVRTKDIAEKMKEEFGKVSVKLSAWPGLTDRVRVKVPCAWYLIPAHFEIAFLEDDKEVAVVSEREQGRLIARDGEDVETVFMQELDELPGKVNKLVLRFQKDDTTFRAIYSVPKDKKSNVCGGTATIEKLMVDDAEISF